MKCFICYFSFFLVNFVHAQIEPKLQVSNGVCEELRDQIVFGNELKVNYFLNKNWSFEGKTFLPIKNRLFESDYRFVGNNEFLLYNQTNLIASRYFFTGSLKTKSKGSNQIEKYRNLGIRGGYFYYQNSFRSYDLDFFIIDSLPDGNRYGISGVKVHNLILGLESNRFKRVKDKKTRINRTQAYADVFLGFHTNVTGFLQVQDNYSLYSLSEKYQLNKNGFGGRLGFQFSQTFNHKIGYFISGEAAYLPRIQYEPNKYFFVPRGGLSIHSLQVSLKVGVTFLKIRN